MRQRVPLVDGHRVGDAVARVEDDTGGAAGGVQGEHGLDGDVPREEEGFFFFFFEIEVLRRKK